MIGDGHTSNTGSEASDPQETHARGFPMTETAASATWLRFQTLTQQATEAFQKEYGVSWNAASSDIGKFVYGQDDCVPTVQLVRGAISAQIDNPRRPRFPQPRVPRVFEISGDAVTPTVAIDDSEGAPDELFGYLMNWLRDVARSLT
jgi:hypothetical protein